MSLHSRLGTTAVFAVVALGIASCSATPPETTSPVKGGELVIAEVSDTAEVDPQVSYVDTSWRIQDLVYDSLLTTNEDSEIVPSIAESWTVEGNVYTFALRTDVTFSNGRALTADDVVGSLERLVNPETASYWLAQVGPVESVVAVDDYTVQVTLASAWEPFLAALASTSAAILPMTELREGTFDPTADWLGTGPFTFGSHIQDQEWTLEKNASYWDAENISIDSVKIQIVADESARIASLRDGSVDIAYFTGPDAETLLTGIPSLETTVQGTGDTYWLMLNAVNPDSPFVDADQRAAVAAAVDRDGLIASALAGTGVPTGITAANLPGSCAPDDLPTYGGSADAAADLIKAENIDPASFTLLSPPYAPVFGDITQYLQQDLEAAGFDVTIESPELGAYFERAYAAVPGDFEATVDYFAGYLSPTMAVQSLLIEPGSSGLAGIVEADPELNQLIKEANAEADNDARAVIIQEMCERVASSANIIPLATRTNTVAVRTDQVNAEIPAFDGYDVFLRNITSYEKLG
jgi:peptide/nickel transport system substrate-binding protein